MNAETYKAEIAAESLVIAGALQIGDWREGCRAAHHVAECFAILDAEARMDEAGVVSRNPFAADNSRDGKSFVPAANPVPASR